MSEFRQFWLSLSVAERPDFASRCETTAGHLRNIAYGSKPCAEKLAIAIERESGGVVRCESLRPDVDWAYLRTTGCRVLDLSRARSSTAAARAVNEKAEGQLS